jgi:hypothetical protein
MRVGPWWVAKRLCELIVRLHVLKCSCKSLLFKTLKEIARIYKNKMLLSKPNTHSGPRTNMDALRARLDGARTRLNDATAAFNNAIAAAAEAPVEDRMAMLEARVGILEARLTVSEAEKGVLEAEKDILEAEKKILEAEKGILEAEKKILAAERDAALQISEQAVRDAVDMLRNKNRWVELHAMQEILSMLQAVRANPLLLQTVYVQMATEHNRQGHIDARTDDVQANFQPVVHQGGECSKGTAGALVWNESAGPNNWKCLPGARHGSLSRLPASLIHAVLSLQCEVAFSSAA